MVVGHFLGGIAAVIWSTKDEKYLLLHRTVSKDFAPGVWECVTGRVEQGESFEKALHREVHEELGIAVKPVCILGTAHFYRGKPLPENELLGVIYGCELDTVVPLAMSVEHDDLRWMTFEKAMQMLQAGDPSTEWLRRVLRRAETLRNMLPQKLRQYHHELGFELG